jgi:hypothetical protein
LLDTGSEGRSGELFVGCVALDLLGSKSELTKMNRRRSRWVRVLVIAALAAALVVAVPAIWQPILRAAGRVLAVEEPLAPADIIVITLDSGGAGALEAADLVQSGIAKRVAVFADPPSGEDHEFIRRGLPYEDAAARIIRQLAMLGVTAVERIPSADAGTSGEGQVLPAWCDEHGFGSIVLISTADHTRRLRRVIDRSMKGHQTRITIRGSRYSTFDPDRWWETRDSVRTEIIEFQKLTLDLIMHPLQRLF